MSVAIPISAFLGLCVGSFLNVVAYRLPRGESVVRPGSRCAGCGRALHAYENVPVLSWIALRGHCRTCGASISIRYPMIEFATGVLYVAVVATYWDQWRELVLGIALVTALVPIAAIDLDVKRIPNAITGPAALAAIPIAALTDPSFIPEQLIAGAAATCFFLLPALISRKGMGMGDVKLAGVMGLYLGSAVAPAIMIALATGTLVGIAVILRNGVSSGRKTAVPFGPFLALGAVASIFFGEQMVDWYLSRF